jgi:hypothetical protein
VLKCVRVEPCHSSGSLSQTSDRVSLEFSSTAVRVKCVVDDFPTPVHIFLHLLFTSAPCSCLCHPGNGHWPHQRSHLHKPWSRSTTRWRKYIGSVVSKATSYGLGQSSILQIAECFRCHIIPGCGSHLTCSAGTTGFGERGRASPVWSPSLWRNRQLVLQRDSSLDRTAVHKGKIPQLASNLGP